MNPVDFWNMTPYMTRQAAAAIADGRTTQAWMTAALTRARRLPKLHTLLNNKPDRKSMEAGLKAAIKTAMARGKRGK